MIRISCNSELSGGGGGVVGEGFCFKLIDSNNDPVTRSDTNYIFDKSV